MNDRISVLMPAYNRMAFIGAAVASVRGQLRDDDELLIVDDGSTDRTAAVCRELLADRRIRYLWQKHTGAPATRNRAIAAAKNPWLLWLDSDDTLLPGVVAHYRRLLYAYPEVDVLYGNLRLIGKVPPTRAPEMIFHDYYHRPALLLARLFYQNQIPNPGTLVRKSIYRRYGGYRTDFQRQHDYEFWIRTAPHLKVKHCGWVVCNWRWHDENVSLYVGKQDFRYDAKIVDRLLELHRLEEIFPQWDWRRQRRAQARVWLEIGKRYRGIAEQGKARDYILRSCAAWPRPAALIELLHLAVAPVPADQRPEPIPGELLARARAAVETLQGRSCLEQYQLASLNRKINHPDEARRRFLALARRLKGKPRYRELRAGAFYHLGEIEEERGDRARARRWFAACRSLNPDHRRAGAALARLVPPATISIVIPYYQGEGYLEKCLHSIRTKTTYPDYEVIVVDDASPRPLSPRFQRQFPGVRFYRKPANSGFTRTANFGAGKARGGIILFLNMDTEVIAADWLWTLNREFAMRPTAGVVGAKLLYPCSDRIQFAVGIIDPGSGRQLHLYQHAPGNLPAANRVRKVDWVTGACLAIRTRLFRRLGGFSRAFHSSLEDFDLCCRARAARAEVWYVPEIALYHHETVTGLSDVHYFKSAQALDQRRCSFPSALPRRVFRADGYGEQFVRVMLTLCHRDFSIITRLIEDFNLATPARQDAFVSGRSHRALFAALDTHYAGDETFRAELRYHQLKTILAEPEPGTDWAELAAACLRSGVPDHQRDEVRLLLHLADPGRGRFTRADFASPRCSRLLEMMHRIERAPGRRAAPRTTPERYLLHQVLKLVNEAFPIIALPLREKYVTFISRNARQFANQDTLIAFFFKLANRDHRGRGAEYLAAADRIIARHHWPAAVRARFSVNHGSYYEHRGDYRRALRYFTAARWQAPAAALALRASIHYHLGGCHESLDRLGMAKRQYRHCLSVSPDHHLARQRLRRLAGARR